ncbi:MAG: hypothetical protein GQ531_02565 [Sulfurovum sp.]|nr:hypothetical protein [Sulfurovum sp.]
MKSFKSLELVRMHPFVGKFISITFSILFVFFLLLFLPWEQTAKGVGSVTALDPRERDYKIKATVDGFIDAFYVHENHFVKKGEKLFRMRDLDADYENRLMSIREKSIHKHDNTLVKLENLKENLKSQKKVYAAGVEIYKKKIAQLKNSLLALKEQGHVLKNKRELELTHYKRSKILYKNGTESKRDLELKNNIQLETKAQYLKIIAEIKNTEYDLEITEDEKTKFINETEQSINDIKNNILTTKNLAKTLKQSIEKESTTISRYMSRDILAKSDGYVVRIYLNDQNRLIKRGEPILYFSPLVTQRAIRMRVSDFNMPLMKEGLKTRIMFYGWPALQIAGWPKIKHGTYAGIIRNIERTSHEENVFYAVIVEDPNEDAWPENESLRVGTQATLWVRLSVVTIWYELWRLMVAQPPKMPQTNKADLPW